jgi:hypothetical protein
MPNKARVEASDNTTAPLETFELITNDDLSAVSGGHHKRDDDDHKRDDDDDSAYSAPGPGDPPGSQGLYVWQATHPPPPSGRR